MRIATPAALAYSYYVDFYDEINLKAMPTNDNDYRVAAQQDIISYYLILLNIFQNFYELPGGKTYGNNVTFYGGTKSKTLAMKCSHS